MQIKKISLEERSKFIKRKIVKTKADMEGLARIGLYGFLGSIVGGGFIAMSMAYHPESEILNQAMIVFSAIGGACGLMMGADGTRTKINYYDDGLCDGENYELNSKIWDKDLYQKKLKEEKELFEKSGYSIKDEDIGKKQKGVVYDDGLRLIDIPFGLIAMRTKFGPDFYVYLRGANSRKTLEEFENSPLVKSLRDPKVESVQVNEGTGEIRKKYYQNK